MALTLAQKSDVRRHLEFPVAGLHRVSTAGGTLATGSAGYRFFNAYGQLEYRLNNMMPDEESRLVGLAYGGVMLLGVSPSTSDTWSITVTQSGLTGSPVTVQVAATTGDTGLTLVSKMAAAIAGNANLTTAGFQPVAPYGTGPFSLNVVGDPSKTLSSPIPEIALTNPATFTITSAYTGTMGASVTSNGALLDPKATVDPTTNPATVVFGYVPILNWLEGAVAGATQNLDTSAADVWTARPTEIRERMQLYHVFQAQMSRFLGVEVYGAHNAGRVSV